MTEPRLLRFYLNDGLRQSAIDGQHNFIGQIETVVREAGYRVEYRRNSKAERLKSATRKGYALFHMDDPFHDKALMFRRVYQYPFWAIERSAKRWEWHVARSRFLPSQVPRPEANKFYTFWQSRLFGSAPGQSGKTGFIFVPLQGRLTDHRSFQYCSPTDMIRHVLDQDKTRPVLATLHPNEHYSDNDLQALDDLVSEHPRLTVQTGQMEDHLAGCDYVVTQNSSAAFSGFFFGKPAILFARIDFHHIAANVFDLGVSGAFEHINGPDPDYAGYIHWFWQKMAINAGRGDAKNQIRTALIRAEFPIK